MNFRFTSAWAVLLALAVSLAISPAGLSGNSWSDDANFDGQADVWQFYDDEGQLVTVMRDRNFDGFVDSREVVHRNVVVSHVVDQDFDHRFDLSFSGVPAAQPDLTPNVAPQPFLLPRAVSVGDQPLAYRAPVALESSSESRTAAQPSGRAPPAAR
jgi:hypothetical protein